MKSRVRRILWRAVKYAGAVGVLLGANAFGYASGSLHVKDQVFREWPNLPGCELTTVVGTQSADHAYLASILKRSCAEGEFIDYFFYLDFADRQPGRGLSWKRIELQNDRERSDAPVLVWTKPRGVQVTVRTATLSGTLVERNEGSQVEIVQVYEPRERGTAVERHP